MASASHLARSATASLNHSLNPIGNIANVVSLLMLTVALCVTMYVVVVVLQIFAYGRAEGYKNEQCGTYGHVQNNLSHVKTM